MPPRHPLRPNRAGKGNIILGVARVARGRVDGLAQFGGTKDSFLASLAPLIAFPLVGSLLAMTGGHPIDGLEQLLATLCVLLVPPVISHELARLWHRQAHWLHFATAFNWCYWLVTLLAIVLMFVLGIAIAAGLPERAGLFVLVGCLGCYGLWLHWFLARHALQLSGLRAAVLVVAMNLCVAVLVLAPGLLMLNRG